MNKRYFFLLLLILIFSCKNVTNEDLEKNKHAYLKEQSEFAPSINNYLNSNYYSLNSLNQSRFTNKIDSLKNIFKTHINKYKERLDKKTLNHEILEVNFAFDRFILEYPQKHKAFMGEEIVLSKKNQSRLENLLMYFNDADNLSNESFKRFVMSYIKIKSNKKLESEIYDKLDNQKLHANWDVMDSIFTNSTVSDFWKHKYLHDHIDNLGIKNIDNIYSSFMSSCKTSEYSESISTIYNSHKKGRANHIIETYKEIDGYELDMHLFLPNSEDFKEKRPTIIQFHGGSWSKGKPDWFFSTAEAYAKQGWVVGVVEYRIKGKQDTYPFESVKDAKSAIRWIRENAEKYNIDSNKIIVTGNSAGGHLSLATTLIDNWNEDTDNLEISATPNVIIVNSGVYDLTTNATRWITEMMQDKDIVKEISPNHLLKKSAVKMLLIHGEKDRNCPYENAEYFYNEMKSLGNDIKLHTVKDAEHMIWYGKHSTEVSEITSEYIRNLNF
ncbi:prolyl oligopeptidase family serine peptidase [uncultured Aquimarina sp.]|uniref:alpha/beta hydrolase n=1 Tax=uncultured Aquimarina sp. TaxID=575652 RepID=UPI00261330D9|nr:prolyl oligopeptidase family serine peptidase [uncultured Aquimarina sp.]